MLLTKRLTIYDVQKSWSADFEAIKMVKFSVNWCSTKSIHLATPPEEAFHNFRASKSVKIMEFRNGFFQRILELEN